VTGLLVAALGYGGAFGIVAALLIAMCAIFYLLVRVPNRQD
jgi:hypothetical protein